MDHKKYLTKNILPFWLENALDKQEGGIFCSLDKFNNVTCYNKNIWFTGRALWSFANAYNTIETKKEYSDACKSLYTFLKKCILPNGRLPFLTDRYGNVLETKNLFHGEAHAAMGCSAYYKVCKDETVRNDALHFFDIAYNMYMSDEARTETTADGKKRYIFGRDMFALSIAQAMRDIETDDERIEILARKSIENLKNTGYINDISNVVNEYVGYNGELYDYSCFGHLYEACWFILYEGIIKDDLKLKELGKKILDYCTSANNTDDFKVVPMGSSTNDEFFWWPQCEAIIAYYMAYNMFKDKNYLNLAKRIEDFAFKTFADKEGGEWFSKCDKYGTVTDYTKGSQIKGVFHLPRMLMMLASEFCVNTD